MSGFHRGVKRERITSKQAKVLVQGIPKPKKVAPIDPDPRDAWWIAYELFEGFLIVTFITGIGLAFSL